MKVYEAISKVAGDLAGKGISKDSTNTQQGFKFRGIDDVYNVLAPILVKHGLVILPRILSRETVEKVNAKGTTLFYTVLKVEFDFISVEDGSKHTVVMYSEAMDSGDKSTSKACSMAYKYACFQSFCIPTEGDNDADATTHEIIHAKASTPYAPVSGGVDGKRSADEAEIKAFITKFQNVQAKEEFEEIVSGFLRYRESASLTPEQFGRVKEEKDKADFRLKNYTSPEAINFIQGVEIRYKDLVATGMLPEQIAGVLKEYVNQSLSAFPQKIDQLSIRARLKELTGVA